MNELEKGCTLQHGKYTIVKMLGQGSFGITYQATTKITMIGNLGRLDSTAIVAIKEFFMSDMNSRSHDGSIEGSSSSLFSKYRASFKKEAINLSHLDHPNIVKVLDVFDEKNTTYYVMQYINGICLDDYIAQKQGLPESVAMPILRDICNAVQYIHSKNMLHLDIKPKNVMLDADGKAYLIDFGLSKQYTDSGVPESSTTLGLGTPGYAPIEQANYKQDGTFPATLDIYALGATLFKIFAGCTPPLASEILCDGFPEEVLINKNVNSAIVYVVKKAMNPMKRERYQTVSDFIKGLDCQQTTIDSLDDEDWGSFKIYKGEAEYGTLEVVNVAIDNPLPVPDNVYFSFNNPSPGGLSYEFNLNNKLIIVLIKRNGNLLYNDSLPFPAIKLIDALKQYGFFSREHWEEEGLTSPLSGFNVNCTFSYDNGEEFVRSERYSNPGYRHLLLDAVRNVSKIPKLNQLINNAVEKEHVYNLSDIENYGISIISISNQTNAIYVYYRGKTYSSNAIQIHGLRQSDVESMFYDIRDYLSITNSYLIDVETYLQENKSIIDNSFNIITYCNEADLLESWNIRDKFPVLVNKSRIIQEMQLLPLCFNIEDNQLVRIEYQQMYCEAEIGGGVVEILQTGQVGNKQINSHSQTQTVSIRKLSGFEGFAYLVLGSIIQYNIINHSYLDSDAVLLTMLPFDIIFEIKQKGNGSRKYSLLTEYTNTPANNTIEVECGHGDFSFNLYGFGKCFSGSNKELGWFVPPKKFSVTVHVGATCNDITILFSDLKGHNRDRKYSEAIFFNR